MLEANQGRQIKKIQRGNRLLILQNHYHIQIY